MQKKPGELLNLRGRLLNLTPMNIYFLDELRTVGLKMFMDYCETPAEVVTKGGQIFAKVPGYAELVQKQSSLEKRSGMEVIGRLNGQIDVICPGWTWPEDWLSLKDEAAKELTIKGLPKSKAAFWRDDETEGFYGVVSYGVALTAAILGYKSLEYLLVPLEDPKEVERKQDEKSCLCCGLVPAKCLLP